MEASVIATRIGRLKLIELEGETATFLKRCEACGILITRNPPSKPMIQEAKEGGTFKPEMFQPFDRLQIVTVQQILDGVRINLPLMEEVTKKAQKTKKDDQPMLLSDNSYSLVHEAFPQGT